jgi:hypothetical protein
VTALIELYRAVDHRSFVEWIVKEYGLLEGGQSQNRHKQRREEMAERVRLYRDDYVEDIGNLIDLVWERPDYRDKLKRFLGINGNGTKQGGAANTQNVSARVVNEVASLYDKPALRTLKREAQQAKFKTDEARLRLHEITQEYHRLLWVCNEVLVWQYKGVDEQTKLRVVTPDIFDAIPHTHDVTVMAGVLMAVPVVSMAAKDQQSRLPCWELWDDTFRYLINAGGHLVDENGDDITEPQRHGLLRIPGVLLHRREPSDRCLDPRPGRDIAAAHRAVCLYNIMILRLAKTQGERQPVITGNLANMAKGQTADGENPLALPPEVDVRMLDTRTDPTHYVAGKKETLASLGQSYGLSYEQMTFTESSQSGSGKAYQVRREKLSELRGEQVRRAKVNEAEVVELLGYDATGMKVDHSKMALPQDPTEEVALLQLEMRVGADSPVRYVMRKDPDMSREDAVAFINSNLADFSDLIKEIRALNIPADATAANPGNDPQINGKGQIVEKLDLAQVDGGSAGQPPAPAPTNGARP